MSSAPPEHPFVTHMRASLGGESMKRPVSKTVFYDFVGGVVDELTAEIKKLSERVKALEAADQYKGTWQRAVTYRRGSQVTHKGGLWVALIECDAGRQPGENPACWQLAMKKGKK